MDGRRLREAYWPADTTRPILDVCIGRTLAATADAVPGRTALIEVVPTSMPSPVGAPHAARRWTYAQLQDDARRCASWLLRSFETDDRIRGRCCRRPTVAERVGMRGTVDRALPRSDGTPQGADALVRLHRVSADRFRQGSEI